MTETVDDFLTKHGEEFDVLDAEAVQHVERLVRILS